MSYPQPGPRSARSEQCQPGPPDALGVFRHGFARAGEGGRWRVWAPRAPRLDLVLMEGGVRKRRPMTAQPGGWFTHDEPRVPEGLRYLFRFDDGRERPDPASRWQPDGVHQASAVWSGRSATWTDGGWRGIPLADLVIYELHVGTFTSGGTFADVVPRLGELADVGVNCLELMPVAQFPGERGWGYDGVYPFAVQQSYGGPAALQRLVDACHAAGLAVILDVVYNHLGPEGNYAPEFGPYFAGDRQTPWGAAWNYDGAGSSDVRAFVLDNVRYWLREFHVDGLRLDAVQTIFDRSATHVLTEIQGVANEEAALAGRPIHVIAETNQNDVRLLQPPENGGYGVAAQWSDDFHHAVHALLTGERAGYYADFGEPRHVVQALNQTFVYDGAYSVYRGRRHGTSARGLARERFVISIQNHDQTGNRALGERFGELLSPAQQRLAAGLLLLSPCVPLLFMGEEYGETHPFPYFCDFGDPQLVEAVRRGRREEFASFPWPDRLPDPHSPRTFHSAVLQWQWREATWQAGLRAWYRALLSSRRRWPRLPDDVLNPASWHPGASGPEGGSPGPGGTAPRGVLRLVRSVAPGTQAPEIWAYCNLGGEPCELPPDDAAAPSRVPLLSSEWPPFGGARNDGSWQSEWLPRHPWSLLPWEVLVLTDPARRGIWQIH